MLEGQTVIGQSEEGAEFDIIMIPKLIELITPICSGRITTEEINSLIKKMNENQADNFLLKELLPLFGEDYKTPDKKAPDEEENDEIDYDDLMENIDKLDEESMAIIIGIIQYLEGKNENVFDLYKNSIYKQQISVGEHEIGIEVIDAQDFYGVLKEAGILTEEHPNLSTFLSIDTEYPNIFLVKKIVKLIEHIKESVEQKDEEGILKKIKYI